ncbi:glycosyltransferase family 2 protein [Azospirillum sp. B506]|uniref:glycosyltransferase family 2 protein n=1 Tax=Azospirillum sp. B506 TaxID=137721 RepID=UPI0011DD67C8|nr:glycosyltransferase family 2 protein [Azospirillum sp. B506]
MLGEFRADLFDGELAAAGIGSGHHAFAVKLPNEVLDGRPHLIRIVDRSSGTALARDVEEIFFPPHLHGQLDSFENATLRGWAFDEQAPGRSSLLDIEVDDAHVATVPCNQPRPDLGRFLQDDGRHGFRFPLPASLFDGRPHRIAVRFANTDRHLVGSPLEVRLPEELLTTRRRRLDRLVADRQAALEEAQEALAREPANRLNDPEAYRAWLGHHEHAIGQALAAVVNGETGGQTGGQTVRVVHLPGPHSPGQDAVLADFVAAVAEGAADAVVFLESHARLHPAFLPLVQAALTGDDAGIVYTDEDSGPPESGRGQPHFKPDWDADRYCAFPYVGFACAIGRDCLTRAVASVGRPETRFGLPPGPFDARAWAAAVVDTALLLADPGRIRHLPFVLYHRNAAVPDRPERGMPERAGRIQAHLDRIGAQAEARMDSGGRVRVHWRLPAEPPPVTIVIPTRDRVDLLKPCVESIVAKTTYPRYDIVIIDNDSRDPATLAYLQSVARQPGIWVRRWPMPFNYAAMHNAVIGELAAPYVALLNNDIEVIGPEWLEEMMGHALRPEIGAVGAKLLYPDGTIQHGGVLVGQHGAADAAQRAFGDDEDGYFQSAAVVQSVSAVTAACMVVRRTDYLRAGGMDAENFSIAFNDVDLCLKLRQLGLRILWTPHARLYHHESATRQTSRSPDALAHEQREVAHLRLKWQTDSFSDPFYSPNLTRGIQTHVDFNWNYGSVVVGNHE